jgi:RsiW-degrading membrane proteinase PrsW (M82 family)
MKDLGIKLLLPALVFISIVLFYFSNSDYLYYLAHHHPIHLFWAILFLVVGVGLLLLFGLIMFRIVEKKWSERKLAKKFEEMSNETC